MAKNDRMIDLRSLALSVLSNLVIKLTPYDARAKSHLFKLDNGQVARLRTSRDGILLTTTSDTTCDATLDLQACDCVIFAACRRAAPENVDIYIIPLAIVDRAFRDDHAKWLASKPRTKGENRTWQMVFDDQIDKVGYGYAQRWAQYRVASVEVMRH